MSIFNNIESDDVLNAPLFDVNLIINEDSYSILLSKLLLIQRNLERFQRMSIAEEQLEQIPAYLYLANVAYANASYKRELLETQFDIWLLEKLGSAEDAVFEERCKIYSKTEAGKISKDMKITFILKSELSKREYFSYKNKISEMSRTLALIQSIQKALESRQFAISVLLKRDKREN